MSIRSILLTATILSCWSLHSQTGFGSAQLIHEGFTDHTAVWQVLAIDVDNDGDQDILSASSSDTILYDNYIIWYENDGIGNFDSRDTITTKLEGRVKIHAADLDNDGDIDVLSASRNDNKIAWYENDGNGNFGTQQVIVNYATGAVSVYSADLDADGDQDVMSASATDNVIGWYRNDGEGNFGPRRLISLRSQYETVFIATAADMDGDDDIDVIFATHGGLFYQIGWFENDSEGNFIGNHTIYYYNNPLIFSLIGSINVSDLDGDGDTDVLATYIFSSVFRWFQNDGQGSFDSGTSISTAPAQPINLHVADLDLDADMDIITASFDNYKLGWLENEGQQNFSDQQPVNNIHRAWTIHSADLDGDDDQDIVIGSGLDRIIWFENYLEDTIPPEVNCKEEFNLYLADNGWGRTVMDSIFEGASDNFEVISVELSDSIFSCVDLGSNFVELVAFDRKGNSDTCFTEIIVLDTIPPSIICQDLNIQVVQGMSYDIENDINEFIHRDNCAIPSLYASQTIFTDDDIGDNLISVSMDDDSGNSTTCAVNVHVEVVTGISETHAIISISPNPVNGYFQLSLHEHLPFNYDLIVANIMGQVVYSIPDQSALEQRVSIQNLPHGVYYLMLSKGDSNQIIATYKLLVQ